MMELEPIESSHDSKPERSEYALHTGLCDPGNPRAIAAMRRWGYRQEQKKAQAAARVKFWLDTMVVLLIVAAGWLLLSIH